MELRDYLRLFRRRWWIIVGVALAGAALAWITAPAAKAPEVRRFVAKHTLIVEPEARSFTPENPETIALLASSGEVPTRVAARLGLEDPGRALGSMTILGDSNLGIVTLEATTDTAASAMQYADVFAEELVVFLDEQEAAARQRDIDRARDGAAALEAEISAISQQIEDGEGDLGLLEERRLVLVAQYGDAEAQYQALISQPPADSGLKTLGPSVAVEADAGIQAPRGRNERALILGVVGLLLAIAVVTILERVDVRIKTKEDAETAFRMPVIAEIPQVPFGRRRIREVISYTQPASSLAEAYRGLRTTLLILKPAPLATGPAVDNRPRRRATDVVPEPAPLSDRPQQVYLVTSTRPSEGKTTTVANLAAVFAEAGRSVLIIGADIRRPEIHHYMNVRREPGLTDVLNGGYSGLTLADVIVPTSIPGVSVVTSGSHVSNPGELLLDGPSVLREARELADIVLVDTTPMFSVNDAIQLMSQADAVIVTCRAGRATIEAARRVQEALGRLHVPVAGVVLVGAPSTPGVSSYYYGYQTSTGASRLSGLRRWLRRNRPGDAVDRGAATRPEATGNASVRPSTRAVRPHAGAAVPLAPVSEPEPPVPQDHLAADRSDPALERRAAPPAEVTGTNGHGTEDEPRPPWFTPSERAERSDADPWGWP